MVTSKQRKRKTSEYALASIHRLARAKQVSYGSRKVMRDTTNLGYSMNAVCECLQGLTKYHYHESITYADQPNWLDVYQCRWQAPHVKPDAPVEDDLYIKLRINGDQLILVSFHL